MAYNTQFNGKTGLEVQNYINESLTSLDNKINSINSDATSSKIDDIQLSYESQELKIKYTQGGVNKTSEPIRLVQPSNNTYAFAVLKYYGVSKVGNPIDIEYEWEAYDESGNKIAFNNAKIVASIYNGSNLIETISQTAVRAVRTNTNNVGYFTFTPTKLTAGITYTFNISIDGIDSTGSQLQPSQSATYDLSIEIIDPIINITYNEDGLSTIINDESTILPIANVQVRNNGNNAVTYQVSDPVTGIAGFTNLNSSYNLNNITALQLMQQVITSGNIVQITNMNLHFCLRGIITIVQRDYVNDISTSNIKNIYTNMYYISFMNRKQTTQPTFGVSQEIVGTNDMNNIIAINQFEQKTFKIYAFATYPTTLYTIEEGVQKGEKLLNGSDVQEITHGVMFKTTGSKSLLFNAQDTNENIQTYLGYILDVQSVGQSLSLPTEGLGLELHAIGQQQHSWDYGTIKSEFSNFDWSGNGWNNNAMTVNNSALIRIPYNVFADRNFTISFNVKTSDDVSDEKLIYCSLSDSTYFEIHANRVLFNNNSSSIETWFTNDELHEITFLRYRYDDVQYVYSIYIDGTCQCSSSTTQINTGNAPIFITASKSTINIYDIIAYKQALNFLQIQSIYNYNQQDSQEIISYAKRNSVLKSNQYVTLTTSESDNHSLFTIDNVPVGSKYMLIESFGEQDQTPWFTINSYDGENGETTKKIRHAVGNVKLIEKTADGAGSPRNFIVDRATLSGQGTSSMYYPIKNFRIYFQKTITEGQPYYNSTPTTEGKKAKSGDFAYSRMMYTGIDEDFSITLDGNNSITPENVNEGAKKMSKIKYSLFSEEYGDSYTSAPVNIFCLKADYAESSGSHNTGFARLANDVMNNSDSIASNESKTIPQKTVVDSIANKQYKYDIRSTIDGFPIYLFFKNGNDITYMGKYNLNNEKATAQTFGFEDIDDYFANPIVRNESNVLKNIFGADAVAYYDLLHESYEYNDQEYINPTECWEFSNNKFTTPHYDGLDNNLGAFQYPYNSTENPFTATDEEGNLIWLSQAWEYRYPDFDSNSDPDIAYKSGTVKPFLLDALYKWLYNHNQGVQANNSMLGEFARDLGKYFNINNITKYFVLTKWFGNVDQRIKNCMLSFYCDPNVEQNNVMGHMRAFYIFYDNDTILGLDNKGVQNQSWDIDEEAYPGWDIDNNKSFHAIWGNLELCYRYYAEGNQSNQYIYNLGYTIERAYQALRRYLTDSQITSYITTQQEGSFPEIIHNLDQDIKYIKPSNLSSLGTATALSQLPKYQGNRRSHRKRWLSMRTRWFDSKFQGGDYSNYGFSFKASGTAIQGSSFDIKVRSAFKDWRFYVTTSSANLAKTKLLPVQTSSQSATMSINKNSFSVSDFVNICGLYGASMLDLSSFNMTNAFGDFSASVKPLPYMKELYLNRSDSPYKTFEATMLSNKMFGQYASNYPNLEILYLCNIQSVNPQTEGLSAIDISSLNNLKTLNCHGTKADVILPNGSNLESLILYPSTMLDISNKSSLTSLTIDNITNLTSINVGKGNNLYTYKYILGLLADVDAGKDVTIYIAKQDNSALTVDNALIDLLYAIKDKNFNVSGSINVENVDESHRTILIENFQNFAVSYSDSSQFELISDRDTYKEGETFSVTATEFLNSSDSWSYALYTIDGQTLISEAPSDIHTYAQKDDASTNRAKITFTVNHSAVDFRYILRVWSTEHSNISIDITIYCVAATSFVSYVYNDNNPSNTSTKIAIIDNSLKIGVVFTPADQTRFDKNVYTITEGLPTEDKDDFIPTLTDEFQHVVISSSNPIQIVKDALIPISDTEYSYLKNVLKILEPDNTEIQNYPKYSYLRKYTYAAFVAQLPKGTDVGKMNLSLCRYLVGSSQITIPSDVNFTDFSVPAFEQCPVVTFTLGSEYSEYRNIKFNESANTISVSGQCSASGINFDFTPCTKIKTIGCFDNPQSGTANINISLMVNPTSSPIIKCSDLTQLGNSVSATNDSAEMIQLPTMFSRLDNTGNKSISNQEVDIQIKVNSVKNIGIINSFISTNSRVYTVDNMNNPLTYTGYDNILDGAYFSNNHIAYNNANSVIDVDSIGIRAFGNSSAIGTPITIRTESIANHSFFGSSNSISFNLNISKLKSIGQYAFATNSQTAHTINFIVDSEDSIANHVGEFTIGQGAFSYCTINTNDANMKSWLESLSNLGDSVTIN